MNPRHFATLPILCVVACAFAASAAELPPMSPPQQPSRAPAALPNSHRSIPQLLQDIKDEIGDAACDANTQCHSVGIGAKACGGAEAFFSWSSKDTDRDRLNALVARYRDARQAVIERSGAMSDCRVIPNPGAVCRSRAEDGRRVCQSGQGGAD